MKKLLLGLGLTVALACQQAMAVVQVFTIAPGTAWNSTNFFTIGSRINSIALNTGSAGGATNLVYALIDAPTNAPAYGWGPIKQTNFGFMQISQYLTNITRITTNFSGFMSTNIFTNAVYTYTNYYGPNSNDWRRLVAGGLTSNSVNNVTVLTGPVFVTYGLGMTNNNIGATITVTVDYDPYL